MEEKIVLILNEMSEYLSIAQMKKLQEVVLKTFSENEADKQEISNNDFFVGVQYHPEFKSRPNRANPIIKGFIKATVNK